MQEDTKILRKLKILSQSPNEIIALVERVGEEPEINSALIAENLNSILRDIKAIEKLRNSIETCVLTENNTLQTSFEMNNKADLIDLQNEILAREKQVNAINNFVSQITNCQKTISSANGSVGLGYNAVASANYAIQLGAGENSKANSFQIFGDNIYDSTNKVITAQQIKIVGESGAPECTIKTSTSNGLKFGFGE